MFSCFGNCFSNKVQPLFLCSMKSKEKGKANVVNGCSSFQSSESTGDGSILRFEPLTSRLNIRKNKEVRRAKMRGMSELVALCDKDFFSKSQMSIDEKDGAMIGSDEKSKKIAFNLEEQNMKKKASPSEPLKGILKNVNTGRS